MSTHGQSLATADRHDTAARRIPWEDRRGGLHRDALALAPEPDHRRDHLPRSNSIFNSAVVPFGDGFAGVFRVDDSRRTMNVHAGRSADGDHVGDRRGADRVRRRPTTGSPRSSSRSSTPTTRV